MAKDRNETDIETATETAAAVVSQVVDLDSLNTTTASDEGAEFELLHPVNEKPLGIFITVLGKHSQIFREHIKDTVNERIRRSAMAERTGKTVPPPTAEETERRAVELLVLCTLGWRFEARDAKTGKLSGKSVSTITHKGQELPFTVQNASNVYSEIIWLREQVDRAVGDLELFIKA